MKPAAEMRLIQVAVSAVLCIDWCFSISSDFNIFHTKTPVVFRGDKASQFGYRVVQAHLNGTPRLVVSAPLSGNRTGALFHCSYDTEQCQPVVHNYTSGISLGLSLATEEASSSTVIACGPTWERQCNDFIFLNSICYLMSSSEQHLKEIRPVFQECLSGADVVILYDDSGSIRDSAYLKMQTFFVNLMDSVDNRDVQFAVVQFSTEPSLVFDFDFYNRSRSKVKETIYNAQRARGNTFTPTAILTVVERIFTPERGMRPHSKKLLIVLTDGESNDKKTTFEEAIGAADKKGIIRYAIGVGRYFLTAQGELLKIASSPSNVFSVESFDALHRIQDQLKQKIFAIEGVSRDFSNTMFQQELSQGGFSTVLTQDHVVFGAVGSYSWSGGLEEESLNKSFQTQFLNMSSNAFRDSYLGYAVALARYEAMEFYVAGAPRYQHVGRVVVFERQRKRFMGFVSGRQVGSYFGAELCSVDLNADGNTDLVLVGAPLFYNGTQGGLVNVYSISKLGRLLYLQTLHGVPGNALGRFGAALSHLGDVSGDGLADVAVGAPMEDEDRGAVYIFLGHADRLREQHSQRIAAATLSSTLHYFGRSIQGKLDLTGDNLTDLAVGALGSAVVLRSRPVFTVISSLNFSHPWVPLDDPRCGSEKISGTAPRGNLSICFMLKLISKNWSHGALRAKISFTLLADAAQSLQRLRLENEHPDKPEDIHVGTMQACIRKTLYASLCLDDTLSPLVLRMNFSVEEKPDSSAGNIQPLLDPGTNMMIEKKVPFKRDCGPDDICVSDLRISFNFSGSKGLKLTPSFILNLTLKLENVGETAEMPSLSFFYTPILSFQGASVLQSNWRLSLACKMHGSQGNTSTRHSACQFSPPFLKGGTQAFLQLSFRSSTGDSWRGNFVHFALQAHSENENDTLGDNEASGQLPVLQPVTIIVKGLESTTYLNFSATVPEKKILTHTYEVRNLGSNPTPVNVSFELPLHTELGFFWNVTLVYSDKGSQSLCTSSVTPSAKTKTKDLEEPITRGYLGAAVRKKILCPISNLPQGKWIKFSFSGEFYRQDNTANKLGTNRFHLRSEASVVVDETRFFQSEPEEFQFSQISTEVELISPFNPVPIIIGSTIGGIVLLAILVAVLYKFGFFKRNRLSEMDEPAAETTTASSPQSS